MDGRARDERVMDGVRAEYCDGRVGMCECEVVFEGTDLFGEFVITKRWRGRQMVIG